jgi:hypothetical protein
LLYEMVEDLSRQRSCQDALDTIMIDACDLVPADRGLSLMKMEGRIPYCLRWPAYADKLVPLFNSTLNRRSPFYYQPPYAVLPVVDWFDYRESEYHREFNVPLGIRYSLGVGIHDFSSDSQYALFVHRSTRDAAFDDEDVAALGAMREAVSNLLTLIGSGYAVWDRRIRERECRRGCGLLSPREREVAQLICRGITNGNHRRAPRNQSANGRAPRPAHLPEARSARAAGADPTVRPGRRGVAAGGSRETARVRDEVALQRGIGPTPASYRSPRAPRDPLTPRPNQPLPVRGAFACATTRRRIR